MPDHSKMRLGRRAPRLDPRTLKLARYLSLDFVAPESCAWSLMLPDWGMMANDRLGCCTIAGIGHAVQTWTEVINQRVTVSDEEIIQYYSLWDGYVPGRPNTDQGGIELDVLNRWRQQSFSGHSLLAYGAITAQNLSAVKQAIALFGGLYIGIAMPLTAQRQDVWDVQQSYANDPDAAPWSWGGHCVWVLQYDPEGLTCVTWGELKRMTWAFWQRYCDEAYGLISPEFVANGTAPSGFDLDQLQADLKLITA